MNIQQLRYFATVAEHLNFSEAAKHHYVAQSALSYSIANLESELGAKLFVRDTRSVKLTAAGEVFYAEIRRVLDQLDQAVAKTRLASTGTSGQLKVAFLSTLLKRHFADWIMPVQEKYPNVTLTFEQMYMANLRQALEQRVVDVGFTRSFDLVDSPDLQWVKLYDSSCALFVHEDNPLAHVETIDYQRLSQEPFIIIAQHISPFWYSRVIQICGNRGFTPRFVHTPLSMEMAFTLLNAGIGVALLPESGAVYNNGKLKVIPIEGDDAKIDVVVAWKRGNSNPVLPIFLNEIDIDVNSV